MPAIGVASKAAGEPALLKELAATVMRRCDELSGCTTRPGQIERTFLSPAMESCHQLVRSWMEAAGMVVTVDTAGNLRAYPACAQPGASRILFGSHLDTVPNAGRYDGVLGVMIGLALAEATRGESLPFTIEVIGFSDEEGIRFGAPFIGSRAIVDELSAVDAALVDAAGITMDAALHAYTVAHPEALPASLHPSIRAYIEFHIEQGPVLESEHRPVAAVHSITGQSRATLTFSGCAGHAGTTPMSLRRDALTAAAEWLLGVEALAVHTPGIVATTGQILCHPGAANTIPGIVRCTLDVRSANDELRATTLEAMLTSAQEISERREVAVSHTIDCDQHSVALDEKLTQLLATSIQATQPDSRRNGAMVSGAGHDAMVLAPHLPTAMMFLRSPGGISHHPDESVLEEDVVAALGAGVHFLHSLPEWLTNTV